MNNKNNKNANGKKKVKSNLSDLSSKTKAILGGFSVIFLLAYIFLLFLIIPKLHKIAPLYGSVIVYLCLGIFTLIASIILFGFLKSTGFVKAKKYQFGGAAALFVLILSLLTIQYEKLSQNYRNTYFIYEGIVYFNNNPVTGSRVQILEVKKSTLTEEGKFEIKIFENEIREDYTFQVSYGNIKKIFTNIKHNARKDLVFNINSNIKGESDTFEVEYVTNEIYNQDFIFTSIPWEFRTDIIGEDVTRFYSVGGNGVIPKIEFSSNYPTLAAEDMIIRFHLLNKNDKQLYIDNLFVNIKEVYKITKDMFWNTWMPAIPEYQCGVALNSDKTLIKIQCDHYNQIVKLIKNEPEHYSIKVTGDKTCINKIFLFNIQIVFHDSLGNKYELVSDKDYFIGFISSNPYSS